MRGQAIVTVAGKGMVGVHGIAARTFGAIDAERLSVSTIFQASSESSIGFTLPRAEAERAVASLQRGVPRRARERADRRRHRAAGHGGHRRRRRRHGRAAPASPRACSRRSRPAASTSSRSRRARPSATSPSRSTASEAAEAARRVHAAFQLSKIGGGRAADGAAHRRRAARLRPRRPRAGRSDCRAGRRQPPVRVVGLLDRSGYVFEPRGLSRGGCSSWRGEGRGRAPVGAGRPRGAAAEALTTMAGARRVAAGPRRRHERRDRRPAADRARPRLQRRARQQEAAGRIVGAATSALLGSVRAAPGGSLRYEATVGAGLPIIDTFHKLVETGDRVLRIEGCVSGTLMYVLSAVSARQAVLGGRARGRRARLRRARPARRPVRDGRGAQGADPGAAAGLSRARRRRRTTWYPRALKACRSTQFMQRLPAFDDEWAARVARGGGARTRAALRRDRDAAQRVGEAGRRAGDRARSARSRARATSSPSRRGATAPSRSSSADRAPEPAVTAAGILNDIYSPVGALNAPSEKARCVLR